MKKLLFLFGLLAIVGICGCESEDDGSRIEHICNFGEGDIRRAISAEGGCEVLFDGNDGTAEKYYDWCYGIDLPLDEIDNSDNGGFALLSKELSGEDKSMRRIQFEDYRYGKYIDGGLLPDPGCSLYFFKDAYTPDVVANYSWMHYLPLYTDKELAHCVEVPGWGMLRFYGNGSATIEAHPNCTGKERMMSLVYDRLIPGEMVMSGSVEIRQPAMKAQ